MFTEITGNTNHNSGTGNTQNMVFRNPQSISPQQPQSSITTSVQQPLAYLYSPPNSQQQHQMYANPDTAYGSQPPPPPPPHPQAGNITGGGTGTNSAYGGFPPQQGNLAATGVSSKNMAFFQQSPPVQLPYGYGQQTQGINAANFTQPPVNVMRPYQQQQPQPPHQQQQQQPPPPPPPQHVQHAQSFNSSATNSNSTNHINPAGGYGGPHRSDYSSARFQHANYNGGHRGGGGYGHGGGGSSSMQRRGSNQYAYYGGYNNNNSGFPNHFHFMRGGGFRQVHNNYVYNQQHHYSSNNAVPEKTPTIHIRHPTTGKVLSLKLNRIYSTMADLREQLQYVQYRREKENEGRKKSVEEKAEKSAQEAPAESATTEGEKQETEATTTPAATAAATATDTATAAAAASDNSAPAPTTFNRNTTRLLLCLDFLSPPGCPHGSGCDKVHVAGLEYTWEAIEPTATVREMTKVKNCDNGEKETVMEEETMYNAGFVVRCYDPTLTKYYNIPSESIIKSAGAEKYIAMYNEHGDNFKAKFKLCPELMGEGQCSRGYDCEDIHCVLSNFSALEENHSHRTHINDEASMAEAPRLPAEVRVRIFEPNSVDQFKDYSGNYVLITEGAKTYLKFYEQEGHAIPLRKRMQHCAHFRIKDMCRQGEGCRFLHVLPTPEEAAAKEAMKAEGKEKTTAETEGNEVEAESK